MSSKKSPTERFLDFVRGLPELPTSLLATARTPQELTMWTDAQIEEQFRCDIRERFEKECAAYLEAERIEIAEVKAQLDAVGKPHPDWLAERPSFLWEIYERSEIRISNRTVQVILPREFAIDRDLIDMFAGTSVAWSTPSVGATIVDGEPYVTVELILIDSWDDARHAAWHAERARYKGTTAEDLLRRIQRARSEFAQDPAGPERPLDTLATIESWCDEYFEARLNK